MHEHFLPFSYTFMGSLSEDSGFARSDIGYFIFFYQVFVEIVCFMRTRSFSLFGSNILVFFFTPVVFVISLIPYIYIRLIAGFILLFT